MYEGGNDEFTIESELPFFPLPPMEQVIIANMQQPMNDTTARLETEPSNVQN